MYNRFYEGWLEHKRRTGGYVVKYEDVVANGATYLAETFDNYYVDSNISQKISIIPQSVQLSAEDYTAVIDRKCALSQDVARRLWEVIDKNVASTLSYTFEEINFSESYARRLSLRSAAYKLRDNPRALGAKEFERLQQEGENNFQDDVVVLGEIGRRLMRVGDTDAALNWLARAILAMQRSDNKIFGKELDSPAADYLELLSKACLVVRERKLEDLVRHHTHLNPKQDHYRAAREYNLSRCWMKLGKLDLAIAHARRAIDLADLTETRKGEAVSWIHYLGDLLAKVGERAEAIEKFGEAAARDPANFKHHFRLASEYRRDGNCDLMFVTLNEALRLDPDNAEIIGFKVTALRQFDAGSPDILPLAQSWVKRKRSDGLANFCLADELRKAGDVDEALEYARACARLAPGVPRHHRLLADLLALNKLWNEALAAIDEAVKLEPGRAPHHHFRGHILLKMGRLEEARASLEAATHCAELGTNQFSVAQPCLPPTGPPGQGWRSGATTLDWSVVQFANAMDDGFHPDSAPSTSDPCMRSLRP